MAWSLIGNIKGPTGAPGARGSSWTTSSSSPVAPGEVEGDQHLNSTTGDVFEWTGSAWAARGSIQGPAGAAGSPGVKWFTGTGAPVAPGSNAGDLYLDGDLGDVFEWNGTSWSGSPVGNLAGPTGPQGDIGPAGPPGDPNLLADIAFTGSASDLVAGTIPDARMPPRLGNGVTVATVLTTGALDTTLAGGFYQVDPAASPTGVAGGLLVSGSGVGPATQVFTDRANHRSYTRVFDAATSTWSSWQRIAFLDIARWVTEDADRVTAEDGEGLSFVTGVK